MSLSQLRNCLAVRGSMTLRTTEGIISDHLRFESGGGSLKKAKFFNNAIRKTIFPDIPLSQVRT